MLIISLPRYFSILVRYSCLMMPSIVFYTLKFLQKKNFIQYKSKIQEYSIFIFHKRQNAQGELSRIRQEENTLFSKHLLQLFHQLFRLVRRSSIGNYNLTFLINNQETRNRNHTSFITQFTIDCLRQFLTC